MEREHIGAAVLAFVAGVVSVSHPPPLLENCRTIFLSKNFRPEIRNLGLIGEI